jgi:phosphoenolpyruvate-protein phosphotransferase (PTS system enzyme I)
MQQLDGIAVSPGVAIGEALVIDNEGFRIPRHYILREEVEGELQRFQAARDAVADDIQQTRDSIACQLGEQYGAIFAAHLQMLHDPRLRAEVEKWIREKQYSPEYAVSVTLRGYAKAFQSFDNPYLSERSHDVYDLERRLLQSLVGRERQQIALLDSPVVVLAHNLSPGETANLNRRFVLGFATEIGGAGGHTAIVAKGLEIPAVVGIGHFLADVSGGDLIIIDGNEGRVVLRPDEQTLRRYRQRQVDRRDAAVRLAGLRDLPAVTRDGTHVKLLANIEFPYEASACQERGAEGIGLYRTEFLYLGSPVEPTEEDHFTAYAEVVRAMQGRPVVIRTLDLGADKLGQSQADPEDRNPFLGLRSIRLALANLPLFRPQLRAILRAGMLGDVRVMFPLITTLDELARAKQVLNEARDELAAEGVPSNRDMPVGMMVESPAAALLIDRFITEVDFISIGTNDLIQYTLAVDRGNPAVNDLYQASDPAVLRLIERVIQIAQGANVETSLCGQMSSSPLYTMLLLGLGLRQLSVAPGSIPEIKQVCRSVTLAQCRAVAAEVMTMVRPRDIDAYLGAELEKLDLGGSGGEAGR